jgi:hypothetical protein
MKLDWESLRQAFDGTSPEGANWFLDRDTGEAFFTMSEDFGDNEETEEEMEEMLDRLHPHSISIDPPSSHEAYEWMAEFADSLPAGKLRDLLQVALNGRGAFRRFKDVLLNYPRQREAWFEFEKRKINEAVEEWVEFAELHPENPPPWKK